MALTIGYFSRNLTLELIHFLYTSNKEQQNCSDPQLDRISNLSEIFARISMEEISKWFLHDLKEEIIHGDCVNDETSNQVENDHGECKFTPFLKYC